MDIIDWSLVNWVDVSVYAGMVLLASLIAMLINKALGDTVIVGAVLTTILFGAGYIGWNYYPHGIDVGQTHVVGAPTNTAPASAPLSQPATVPSTDPASEPTAEPMTEEPAAEPATEPATEPAPAPSNQ